MPRCGTGGWAISIHRAWTFYASKTALKGKAQQLVHPNTVNHKVNQPLQLCYGDLMGPFAPVVIDDYKYVSKVTDEYAK